MTVSLDLGPGLAFTKYEGLGNDFVLLRGPAGASLSPERARQLCERHFGVGADGVLLLLDPDADGHDARMIVLNADGSRPEMCGNGLRCAVLALAEERRCQRGEFRVETDAGLLFCRFEDAGDHALIETTLGAATLGDELLHAGRAFRRVSVGNPHAVWFGPLPSSAEIDAVGAALNLRVPGGVNVEFCEPLEDGRLRLVVYERGVGRTLACGTGAAATAAAAVARGLVPADTPVELLLPGGALTLRVAPDLAEVTLRGPARRVFEGRLPPSVL